MSDAEIKVARVKEGIVTSDKRDQTITVLIERREKHPKYRKYIRRSTKVQVHDEANEARLGDVVTIREGRPVSKTKCWRLVSVKERAEAV